jgi:hypothetical protein
VEGAEERRAEEKRGKEWIRRKINKHNILPF